MSFGSPKLHRSWAESQEFQYELWSDQDRTLAMHYQAASKPTAFAPSRVTVVLDGTGNLLLTYPDVSASAHPAEVLEDLQLILK